MCERSPHARAGGGSLPAELERLARWVGDSSDMKDAAMRLVQLGDGLAAEDGESIPADMREHALKVAGCVSTVRVAVSVGEKRRVSVVGEADARVARGMLALLVRGLAGADAEAVVKVDSEELIGLARLREWLPRGRNDGMTNMVPSSPVPPGNIPGKAPLEVPVLSISRDASWVLVQRWCERQHGARQVRAVTEATLAAAARDAAQPPPASSSVPAHAAPATEDAGVGGSSGGSTAAEIAEAGVKAK